MTEVIRPAFHQVTIKTSRLQQMVDWYRPVAGVEVTFQDANNAWTTNDEANHRVAFLSVPGLEDDADKVGQAAIRAWAAEREAMAERRPRHVHGNLRLAAVSPGECRGMVVPTLCRHGGPGRADPAPFMVAEHDDTCRKGPANAWRFAERRLPVLFGG